MNQTYRSQFTEASEIRALRDSGDPATAPLQPVLDLIGKGINFAGRVIENPELFPGLPAQVSTSIREASSTAFISGMDRAFIISGTAIILGAFLSLALIKDRVADTAPADLPGAQAPDAVAMGTAGE